MADIINAVFISIFLLCWVIIIIKFVKGRISPVKSVKAEVSDKYIKNRVSAYPRSFHGDRYMVVFKTDSKKLSFSVSEFSYGSYRIGEKGTLKYKGDRIISFK